jgi:hypothetical protein
LDCWGKYQAWKAEQERRAIIEAQRLEIIEILKRPKEPYFLISCGSMELAQPASVWIPVEPQSSGTVPADQIDRYSGSIIELEFIRPKPTGSDTVFASPIAVPAEPR